jgi:CelD/BcsL family acetyltransferase involved in cellulose biosynthesis
LSAARAAAIFVELVAPGKASEHETAWRDLAARATEPNVFAEPEFLLPALAGFGKSRRLRVLLAWRDAARGALVGVAVLGFPAFGIGAARLWQSEQAGLPALMLDVEAIAPTLEAMIAWVAREKPGLVGLVAPTLESQGPLSEALRALALRAGLAMHVLHPRQRAALAFAPIAASGFTATLDAKRMKEWRRQRRRLADHGALSFSRASDIGAIEAFLELEAKGWKGARGTALKAEPRLAAFARAMLGNFAASGRLTVYRLDRDGAAIAIGLVLRARDRAFYWKTAYEPSLASASPGVQLTLDLSRDLERDAGIALTDSCAISNHPMIDRLWPARLSLIDGVIATRPGRDGALSLWLRGEALRLRARETAKQIVVKLREARVGRG